MSSWQTRAPSISLRTCVIAAAAACLIALASYVVDFWLARIGLHAETTYIDEILLALLTGGLVFVLDASHRRDRQRADELEATNAELMRQSETVRSLSGRLMTLQDEERRRIARNLHDSVGQLVVAAMLQVSIVQEQERTFAPATASAVETTADLLGQISQEVRTISHLLHPPLLDEIGLESALRSYVDGFARRSKIAIRLEIAPGLGRLPRDHETSIFRIVQESLTNVHRHSGSQTALVRVENTGNQLRLEVRDQGRGMPPELLKPAGIAAIAGVGLQGMRERVRELGGKLDIASDPGHGTLLSATLPLPGLAGKPILQRPA
ncbi:MAG TPA: sensor histidine kinase [Terriglobales bacterium]|nr:sensor histidine kinase [Terriglobales bacterium]